jgi:hypothetical protein
MNEPTPQQISELVERWHERQTFEEMANALDVDRQTIYHWTRLKAVKLAMLGLERRGHGYRRLLRLALIPLWRWKGLPA